MARSSNPVDQHRRTRAVQITLAVIVVLIALVLAYKALTME
ncbi:hypothetical protein [Nocardioides luti]|nr:hypothetical protein [Nocardioides luti]